MTEERRRQTIDMEWMEKSLRSHLESLGLSIKKMNIWGHPDDFNPNSGVSFTIKVLGPELPTPQEYIDLLKKRFKDEYYTVVDEGRELPLDYKGAMYLGSVKKRFISWNDVMEETHTDVHYFVFDDAILLFDKEMQLCSEPRHVILSYQNLEFWERTVSNFERKGKEDRKT